MPPRTYSSELKAQVIADAALGVPAAALARKYDMPRSTVRLWTRNRDPIPLVATQKREALGELVYDYLVAGLKALVTQADAMADSKWFKEQGASTYLIHGTLADKLVIIFAGIERGSGTIDTDGGRDSEGEALSPGPGGGV